MTFFKNANRVACSVLVFASAAANAMTVNRLNGGGTVLYVDFSIAGPAVPLEVPRIYNTITALSEKSGWKGAFGWGWTSPLETTMTTTADRQVLLRDGGSGNTLSYTPQTQDKEAIERFLASFKRAYFEQQKSTKLSEGELDRLTLPAGMEDKLRTDAQYRSTMTARYKVVTKPVSGQLFVSTEFGYQTLRFENNRWTRDKGGIVQVFDAKGRLIRQADKNGYYFDYIYPTGDSYQVSEIRDATKSMSLKFRWELGRVAQITDNRNVKALYRYDAVGNLVSVTDSSGETYNYKYENKKYPHLLTKIEYPNENKGSQTVYREFRYDADGLISYNRDKDGGEINYVYGRSSTDPENNFWTRTVNKSGGNKSETYEEFELKKRGDGSKYLYRQTTKTGSTSNISIFSECCGQPLQITLDGVTTQYSYYPDGLLKSRVSASESASFEYDKKWKKPSKVTQPNLVSTYEYDSRGNLVRAANSKKQQVSLKYDSMGRVDTLTNEQRRTFSFVYGGNAKPTMITEAGVGSIELNYAKDGRLLGARTIASAGKNKVGSEQMVKKVQQGFQQLLSILRPVGLSDFRVQ